MLQPIRIVTLSVVFTSLAMAQAPSQDARQLYWIFLTTGKPTAGVDAAKIQVMQQAHLDNFTALHGQGKLLAAGPMSDPERTLRGIVVVKANSHVDVMAMFDSDPYVKNGYMKVEASPMTIVVGEFNTDAEDQGLEELRIVVASSAKKPTEQDSQQIDQDNRHFYQRLADQGALRMAVRRLAQNNGREEVLIFNKLDDDKLQKLVSAIPANKNGWRTYQAMPFYSGKGIFK